ncbi:hyperosmotically inducible periplasmic protein [Alphaproteobacteria bacterium]
MFSKKKKKMPIPEYVSCIIAGSILLALIIAANGCAVIAPLSVATTGMVMADERSVGTQFNDKAIYAKIKKEFFATNAYDSLGAISISVMEGRVLLTGNIDTEKGGEEAVKLAWSIQGVREVINEIVVGSKNLSAANDLWIASQIRAKFLVEKNFVSGNYAISVSDSVVYLLGIAQTQEELNQALLISSGTNGVQKIVTHVILKDDPRRWGRF